MAEARLSFEQRKVILKWYFKFENVCEVQRQWRREFATKPPIRLIIARIRDKFETDGTVRDVDKQRSGRPRTATSPASSVMVLGQFTRSPQKSPNNMHVRQELADQVYNASSRVQNGKFTSKDCYMP
jgi:hypothetical protein